MSRMSSRRASLRRSSQRPLCLSCPGGSPARVRGAPVWLPALLLASMLGGCSSSGSWQSSVTPAMAGASVASTGPAAEVEFDGLETQRAPRRRTEPAEPDDPSEPFSPNYGAPHQADPGAPRQAATALDPGAEP